METYEMWIVFAAFIFTWWQAGKEIDCLKREGDQLERHISDLKDETLALKREIEKCKSDIDRLETSTY